MIKKYLVPLVLLLITLICYYTGPRFQEFYTYTYNQKLYQRLDYILHFFTKHISFSLGDVLYAIVVLWFLYKSYSLLKGKLFKKFFLFIFTSVLWFLCLFQLMWGLNNYKHSITEQLDLERNYTQNELDTLTYQLIKIVNDQQQQITKNITTKVIIEKDLDLFNQTAKENYEKLPETLRNILVSNPINDVKPSFYSIFQSYSGFSGYFNPFTHENQVNIEIPTIGMPVTVAHEMAHQLGIASESEANFFGYQVMNLSEDIRFQYAANLYALKYCLKEYRIQGEDAYQELFIQLHPGVQQNILDSEAFWQSKRNISTFFFKHLYGRFLKINNQKDGIRSYNRFVDLLINYNKKYMNIRNVS